MRRLLKGLRTRLAIALAKDEGELLTDSRLPWNRPWVQRWARRHS